MPRTFFAIVTSLFIASALQAGVVINEIMYRPAATYPEPVQLEFIELHNTDPAPVNIGNWVLNSGVNFTFPAGTTIPAGGFVLVAADPLQAEIAYGRADFLGPWTGTLSNNGERVRLSKPGVTPGTFDKVDEVTYSSEGDWASRVRVVGGAAAGGWDWSTNASIGHSLELRNPALSNDNGQNWSVSTSLNGTPGTANSALAANIAPIIKAVKHAPAVPKPADPVTISCELNDETAPAGLGATLFWRNATTASPGAFQSLAMTGDGTGKFSATLAALPNLSIVEFYISATDGAQTRTWPAATAEGQTANCQYQVINETLNNTDTYYFIVMTAAENAIYEGLATSSDREMNQTFITYRAGETSVRYRAGMRIRGKSSRSYVNRPMRIAIPGDELLDGEATFNLNPKYPWLQFAGMRLMQASGVRAADALPVEVRRNGVEYSTGASSAQDFGKWVRVEDEGRMMVANHWPEAGTGNLYKNGASSTTLGWRSGQATPSNPDGLIDGWSKQNNSDANDWSDYQNFATVWQTQAASHFTGATAGHVQSGTWQGTAFSASAITQLETVADLDQFARWFAVMTIFADNETNISNGREDDYAAYFYPETDGRRRMQLIAHDFDTIFGEGDSKITATARGLFDMTETGDSFKPLLPLFGDSTNPGNAAFRTKYFNAIRELYGTVLNSDTTGNPNPPFYQWVDANLTGWVPAATITSIKTWMTARQAHLLGLIGAAAITPPAATSTSTLAATPAGGVVIHEVLADNRDAYANGASFPDVIELRNTGASPVDVSGMTLSDDPLLPAKYTLPAGTTIPAGATLIIHADAATEDPGLHAGFQLDSDGDSVLLYASTANGGALVDSVSFGAQAENLSIGRTGGPLNTWALCTPTIGAANTAVATLGSPAALKINEWGANPDYLLSGDFVELYNPSAQPVAIGGMRVTDDPINYSARHVFPPLSFVPAGGFLRVNARGGDASPGNSTELAFSLNSTFGNIALFGANGTTVDLVPVIGQPRDTSTGRSPDGATTLARFALPSTPPTPGSLNVAPPAGVMNLINFLRVTEILFRPNALEYIELQNTGTTTLDLSGVQFTSGISYTFDTGVTLAPGAFIVVCKDRTAFIAQFGALPTLAARNFTGTLDNAGESIALQPPAPWNINILNFSYDPDWFTDPTFNHSFVTINPAQTAARDWNEKETWSLSPQVLGSPGSDGPPAITSALTASAITGNAFSYQIAATRLPLSYNATSLPSGLVVDTGTGLISGTPQVNGVFNVSISATNSGGTDTKTLVLTISLPPPPVITSSLAVQAAVSAPFSYQITGSNNPTSYNATGMPAWLSVNTGTGVLSGTPPAIGTFTATITATNAGGSDSKTLNIEVSDVGPFANFQWEPISAQVANTPFNATLRAVDSFGRTVDYNGPVNVGAIASTAGGVSTMGVVLTEFGCASPTPDYFEIQNLGSTAVNTAGWFVITNRSSQGVNSALATTWALPASLAPGQIVGATDGTSSTNETYYGVDIDWPGAPKGWVILSDASGTIRDFCAWGYTAAEIATINFTSGGFTYTIGSQWSGDGAPIPPAGSSLFRSGISDSNSSANWALGSTPSPRGAQNSGLAAAVPLAVTPASINLAGGVATAPVRVFNIGNAVLTATAQGAPVAFSSVFDVTTPAANTPPYFIAGGNQTVPIDSGVRSIVAWATGIRPGASNEASQTVSFVVSSNNPALFAVQPALDASGALTFTPQAQAAGTAVVSITPVDNGGTANGGIDTGATQNFSITLLPNTPPSFTKGADITAGQTAGAVTRTGWATAINAGVGETEQTVSFTVTNSNTALFSVQPAVSPSGTLTFTPAGNLTGVATVSVTAVDSGGTNVGGLNSSATATFTISVVGVNQTPTFTAGANLSVRHNVGAQIIPIWATQISAGPAEESGQTLTFEVGNSANDIFLVQPAISASGTLTFTPHPWRSGAATVTATLRDNGGTANGAIDFITRQFTITTRAVNDAPSFVPAATTITAGVGAPYAKQWATSISAGPPDESSQSVTFVISNSDPTLFTNAPTLLPNGTLTFTPGMRAGTATLTVRAKDNGGIDDGGTDESAPLILTVRVTSALEAAGTYLGLIVPDAGVSAPDYRHFGMATITLSKTGGLSGSVIFSGRKYPVKGKVNDLGVITLLTGNNNLALTRKPDPAIPGDLVSVILSLQFQNGDNPSFTGLIKPAVGAAMARFAATRPVYNGKSALVPAALLDPLTDKGKYTAALLALTAPNNGYTAAQFPQGDGNGSFTISKTGAVKFAGKLADGTACTMTSALLIGDQVPFYVALYGGKGLVSGTVTARSLPGSDADGASFRWFRPAIAKPAHPGWPQGINTDFIACKLLPKSVPLLPSLGVTDTDGNANVDLSDATLPLKAVNVDAKNKITVIAPATDKLKATASASSGKWSGSFVLPSIGKTVKFSGVILRKAGYATGYYLDGIPGGRVQLAPAP